MGRTAETLIGAVFWAGGRAIGGVQTALRLQPRPRPLAPREAEVLRRVYRDSLDLAPVRIVEGAAGLFGLSARPFTLGNVIYMKKTAALDVLVHEACHVWQNQHEGSRYIGGAIIAQATKGRAAYDWKAERRSGKSWREFNREAQAQMIQELYALGFFADPPRPVLVGGEDWTAFARETVDFVRRGGR